MKKLTNILIITIISILICSCSMPAKESTYTNVSGFYFDTFISINIYDEINETTLNDLTKLMEKYDHLFSEDNPDSDIYKLNHNNGTELSLDSETIHVLSNAFYFAEKTDGLFDPTIQAVQELWSFDGSSNVPPSSNTIEDALAYVDYSLVTVDSINNKIICAPGQKFTVGATAKGYIADKIKEFLINNNINNALIDLGGNILCLGSKENSKNNQAKLKPYEIGIKKPFSTDTAVTLSVTNKSVVTSGIYERYFIYEDILYHHILDTTTGYPVNIKSPSEKQLSSVSVIGPSSEICDCLSTSIFIMGEENGQILLDAFPEYCAMFIYSDDSIVYSQDFNNIISSDNTRTRIMLLGDSITYGYCPGYPEGGYRNTLSQLLTANNQADNYNFVGSINAGEGYDNDCSGFSGYTITLFDSESENEKKRPGLSDITTVELTSNQPETIILMIGTNDMLLNNQLDTINQRLSELVNSIMYDSQNLKNLYICTIPYINTALLTDFYCSQEEIDNYTDSFNTYIKDTYTDLKTDNISINVIDVNRILNHEDLIDGIHPSPDAYEKIGTTIYEQCFCNK